MGVFCREFPGLDSVQVLLSCDECKAFKIAFLYVKNGKKS